METYEIKKVAESLVRVLKRKNMYYEIPVGLWVCNESDWYVDEMIRELNSMGYYSYFGKHERYRETGIVVMFQKPRSLHYSMASELIKESRRLIRLADKNDGVIEFNNIKLGGYKAAELVSKYLAKKGYEFEILGNNFFIISKI